MFTSFSLPFWNVNCNGKYKESGASPSASMHANPCQICTGFAAVWEVTQPFPMATASHEGELSAHLWSSIEGMLLAGRVWGYCNEYNCFSHFICRSFFFSLLVYSGLNCLYQGFVRGAALFVCFHSCCVFCISLYFLYLLQLMKLVCTISWTPLLSLLSHGDTELSCLSLTSWARLMWLKGGLFLLCKQQTFRFIWLNWRFLSHFYEQRKRTVWERDLVNYATWIHFWWMSTADWYKVAAAIVSSFSPLNQISIFLHSLCLILCQSGSCFLLCYNWSDTSS